MYEFQVIRYNKKYYFIYDMFYMAERQQYLALTFYSDSKFDLNFFDFRENHIPADFEVSDCNEHNYFYYIFGNLFSDIKSTIIDANYLINHINAYFTVKEA